MSFLLVINIAAKQYKATLQVKYFNKCHFTKILNSISRSTIWLKNDLCYVIYTLPYI